MNIKLANFENHFSDEEILRAEILRENSSIQTIVEAEKHLWIITILDGSNYEVEILISPSKVKKYSCDCELFQDLSSCEHIAAGLFHLREVKTQEKLNRKKSQIERSLPQKIRIKELLPLVSNDEIRIFLQSHLNKDKKLGLSFKARFAQKLEIKKDQNKYLQILDELIKPVTNVGGKMRGDKISHFAQLAEEFLEQFGDLISINMYSEALEILTALIRKTSYVCTYSSVFIEKLTVLNKQVHHHWWEYSQSVNVPELISQQVNVSSQLAGISYYNFEDPDFDLYQFLYKNSDFIDDEILDSIAFKIERNHKQGEDCSYLISALFKLTHKVKDLRLINSIEYIFQGKPEYLSRVLDRFRLRKEFEQLDGFISYIESKRLDKKIDLSSYRLAILTYRGNYKEAQSLVEKEYIKNHNQRVLLYLDLFDISKKKSLIKSLERQLSDLNRPGDLLELFEKTKNHDSLFKHLILNPEIAYLDKYSFRFWGDHSNALIDAHITAFNKYLENHVGYANSSFIANQIQKLSRRGLKKEAEKIKKQVFENFSNRASIEEVFRKV